MFTKDQTVFVLVDVQGKLARIVHDSEGLIDNLRKLISCLRILDVPIIWLEQYPEGLGPTVEEVADQLEGLAPIPKMTFSACKTEAFMNALRSTQRQQILIAGIETHICVYQTAADLKESNFEVQVVEDAVSSRTLANKQLGFEKMKGLGILGTSVEMAIYELLETADAKEFKKVLKIIK
ncbi:hydrolase [Sporosarcina sp. ACRSL]|uniref:hydrolase n=1 Tax=Sporosarcina sp. ACRSL TaxID=2918215 RepID=UPI001EF3F64B|nr:hydrolase [Sporosarcina sp. ACRSL]MCG7345515.1 hydrolase [Sporosarcina sp. ACRSL]